MLLNNIFREVVLVKRFFFWNLGKMDGALRPSSGWCAAAELRRCACDVRLGAVHYKLLLLLVSPQKRRSKVQPLPACVTRIPNEGWGDCLFWSLSQGIQHTGGGSHHHRSVRAVLGWRRGCRDTNLCTSTSLWKKQKMDGKKRGGDARTAMPMIKSWPRKVGSWAGNLDSCTCYHSLQANLTHLWIWTEQEI